MAALKSAPATQKSALAAQKSVLCTEISLGSTHKTVLATLRSWTLGPLDRWTVEPLDTWTLGHFSSTELAGPRRHFGSSNIVFCHRTFIFRTKGDDSTESAVGDETTKRLAPSAESAVGVLLRGKAFLASSICNKWGEHSKVGRVGRWQQSRHGPDRAGQRSAGRWG